MTFDWFTFTAQIINFVILIALLNHFLYQPILDAISDRENKIAQKIQSIETREADAETKRKKYETLNRDMQSQRQLMLEQAVDKCEQKKQRMMQEARKEIQFRRENWLESLRNEQEEVVKMFTQTSGDQVLTIASRALEQLADEQLEQQTLNQFIDYLSNLSDTDREKIRNEPSMPNSVRIESAFVIHETGKNRIERQLNDQFSIGPVEFAQKPELVLGFNLRVGGLKLGWNVQDYLDSLQQKLQRTIEQ